MKRSSTLVQVLRVLLTSEVVVRGEVHDVSAPPLSRTKEAVHRLRRRYDLKPADVVVERRAASRL
jgi:hypothetical protein